MLSIQQSNDFLTNEQVDAYVIVYSVEDRKSFEGAIDRLYELRQEEDDRHKAVILVANKSDLVRTRVILEEGELFVTGNTLVCDSRCGHVTYITIHVVLKKYFCKIFQKF